MLEMRQAMCEFGVWACSIDLLDLDSWLPVGLEECCDNTGFGPFSSPIGMETGDAPSRHTTPPPVLRLTS